MRLVGRRRSDHESVPSGAGTRELVTFLLPFLRPERLSLSIALVCAALSLLAASVIPLLVDAVLAGDVHLGFTTLGLAGLMIASLVTSSVSRWLSYRSSTRVGYDLSMFVYEHTLDAPVLRQRGMRRPSVISRHTSDVDRVENAVDVTITEGLPGVGRIIVSLALLIWIEPKAGFVTLAATVLFLVLNGRISRGMLTVNKARFDTSSEVGAVVDESITAGRNLTGLNLNSWMFQRFAQRAHGLMVATRAQKREASRLVTAARFTGYSALLAVVIIAISTGGSEAGAIAASLLYIDAVVRGLEALPNWLRDLRLAVTSKRRIEQITAAPPRVNRRQASAEVTTTPSLVIRDLALTPDSPIVIGDALVPRGGVVAVVAQNSLPVTALMEVLSGDADPDAGCVLLEGIDVRQPSVKRRITLVTDEPHLMDASVRDHIMAATGDLDEAAMTATLDLVGIGHLSQLSDGGLNAPLGSHAHLLSLHERQRLMLAMAALGNADVVVVQQLPVLADPDSAAPVLVALTQRPARTVLIATDNLESASRADWVLAPVDGDLLSGRHAQLMEVPAYAAMWAQRIAGDTDTRILELVPEEHRDHVRSRLMTEHFRAAETLYRSGSPADRIMLVISGRVEIVTIDSDGVEHRVAEVGPGNFCGDASKPDARRTETVRAIDDTVVRTLSVESWSAGVLGLFDADPAERRVLSAVLKSDHPTMESLPHLVIGLSADEAQSAAQALIDRGQLRVDATGQLSMSLRRRARVGSASVLDRLADI